MQLYEIILSKVIDNSKVKDVLPNEFTFGQFDQVKINPIQKSTEMSIADLYKNRFKQQSNLITQKFYIYNKEINTIIEDNFKFRFVTIFYYNEYYFFKLPKII